MHLKKSLIFIICFVSSMLTHADNWIDLTQSNEENFYFNLPSVHEVKEYNNTYVEAWIKAVIYNDLTKDGLSIGDYTMIRFRFDCNKQMMGLISRTKYKKSGDVFEPSYTPTYIKLDHVIPDSIGSTLIFAACYANEVKQNRIQIEDE